MRSWNGSGIKQRIQQQQTKIEALTDGSPHDHTGGTIPILLAFLGALELVADGDFHGTIELGIKGRVALNPRVTSRTYRLADKHSDLLE